MLQFIRTHCLRSVAPTIECLLLFFLNLWLFGMNNASIALFMTLSFMQMQNDEFRESNMIKTTAIYLGLTVMAYLALLHVAACIVINFFVPFAIIYLFLNEFNPANQLPYELCFILFQMVPVQGGRELGFRLLSILMSAAITYVLLVLYSRIFRKRIKKSSILNLTKEGIASVSQQLYAVARNDTAAVQEEKRKLFEINKKMSEYIYGNDENIFLKQQDGQSYFPFIVVFQHINQSVDSFLHAKHPLTEEDKEYLVHLAGLFRRAGEEINKQVSSELLTELITFSSEHELSDAEWDYSFIYIINYFTTALSDLNTLKMHPSRKFRYKTRIFSRLRENFTLRSSKMRFALRLSISVCPCLVFAYVTTLPHAYWLPLSVFVLTMPYYENSLQKSFDRIIGTLLGIIISAILYYLFPGYWEQCIIFILATFFIYATSRYAFTAIYITCSSLSMSIMMESVEYLFLYRIVYTLIAAVIVILASRFLFPTKSTQEIRNMMIKLVEIDQSLLKELENAAKGLQKERLDRDWILTSYLTSEKIEARYRSKDIVLMKGKKLKQQESDFLPFIHDFLRNNNYLITNLTHIYTLIALQPKDRVKIEALEPLLKEFHQVLQCVKEKLLQNKEITEPSPIQIREIYDNAYINSKMSHSAQEITNLYQVVSSSR